MEYYKIRKDGKNGGVETITDEVSYERVYKPYGWVIVDENKPKPIETTDEKEIKEKIATKRKSVEKKFDDKLVKGE